VSLLLHIFRRAAWRAGGCYARPLHQQGPTAPRLRHWSGCHFSAAGAASREASGLIRWPANVILHPLNRFECPVNRRLLDPTVSPSTVEAACEASDSDSSCSGPDASISARQTVSIAAAEPQELIMISERGPDLQPTLVYLCEMLANLAFYRTTTQRAHMSVSRGL
jgi:hypothetical protein